MLSSVARAIGILISYGCAGATGASAQPGSRLPSCPSYSVDTTSWKEFPSYAFGLSFRAPAAYVRQNWESVSDSTVVRATYRRGDSPAYSLTLVKATESHIVSGNGRGTEMRCTLATVAGQLPVLIEWEPRYIPGREDGLLFSVHTAVPTSDGRGQVVVTALSIDSLIHAEQLAIIRSLRLTRMR